MAFENWHDGAAKSAIVDFVARLKGDGGCERVARCSSVAPIELAKGNSDE